jgi:hypothetical protein
MPTIFAPLPKNKQLFILLLLVLGMSGFSKAQTVATDKTAKESIEGRWDMIVQTPGKPQPSWLEVRHSGHQMLVGQFVGASGSARPISRVYFTEGQLRFSLPPQWENETNDLSFEGRLQDGKLTGSMIAADGKKFNWTASRAPALRRPAPPVWGKPVQLFNGTDLKGWHVLGESQWQAKDGVLHNLKAGGNLVSDQTFNDFKLHIEFRYPKGSNSGVYLRGRYEVQIADATDAVPASDQFGAVYGFQPPTELVARNPGEWQTFDITLVGRLVTVVANGKTVICNREIPGITGGALDSNEGAPGPLLLQGDHGAVEFRNISITPAK